MLIKYYQYWKKSVEYKILIKFHKNRISEIHEDYTKKIIFYKWRKYIKRKINRKEIIKKLSPMKYKIILYYYWTKYKKYIFKRRKYYEYMEGLDEFYNRNTKKYSLIRLYNFTKNKKKLREKYKLYKEEKQQMLMKKTYDKWREEHSVIFLKNKISNNIIFSLCKKYFVKEFYKYITKNEKLKYILKRWNLLTKRNKNV